MKTKNNADNKLILVFLATASISLIFSLVLRSLYVSEFFWSSRIKCQAGPFPIFLTIVSLCIFFRLFYFSLKKDLSVSAFSGLVAGGGLSNILEKLVYGCAADYFNFFGLVRNNIADIFIIVGIIGLIFSLLKGKTIDFK